MQTVTTLILIWFVLRDWPKVLNNFIYLVEKYGAWKDERDWQKWRAEREAARRG